MITQHMRRNDGRFDYSDMTRMCTCGHNLGEHGGEHTDRGCVHESDEPDTDGKYGCSCGKFKPARKTVSKKTKRQFAESFRIRWESEIRDQVELGQVDSAISFWDMSVAASIDDGELPATALNWTPPAWLVALDKLAAQNEQLS